MSSLFPPFLASNVRAPLVISYTPAVAEDFIPHALVVYNTGTNVLDECGADPALILGFALGSAASKTIYADGKIPVHVLDPDDLIGLSSPTTPLESHVGDAFGILKDGTTEYWQADPTDAGNARVVCLRVDIPNGIFYCKFLAANLQLDAIAS